MHRSRALASLTLALCLFAGTAMPAHAVTSSDVAKHREAAESARKKAEAAEAAAKKLAAEVEKLDSRIDDLQEQTDALDPKIAKATKRTLRLEGEVLELKGKCARTEAEIDKTQAEFDTQRGLLAERVQATYKQGTWFYLDLLLGSTDFDDLIARTDLVNRVIESNNNIAASLAATKSDLEKAKSTLERSLEEVDLKRKEARSVEKELRGLRAARQNAVDQQESVQRNKQELVVENKSNAKRLRALAQAEEAESNRIAALLSGGGSGRFSGSMAWPVPASHRVTSSFGWRVHPIFGTKRFHSGVDIGAGSGSAIVAAAAGKVISASYRGGYGNTVMIDHGNGVVTLYAHQKSGGMKVSTGERVEKGERIGTVGSTGYSTGPHLHFEVRVNGSPKNPMGYL